jgi:hypothetical protein
MGSPHRKEIHVVSPSSSPSPQTGLVYGRNEQPRSTHDWVLYSFQWLVTMIYAVVWGYSIVGVGLDFQGARMTTYISAVVLTIGVSTLLQAWLGHRMAMVHGPNVIPSLAIVAAYAAGGQAYALQAFTAQALSGIIIVAVVALGAVRFIRKIWSPLVLGSMIIMIGLTVGLFSRLGLGSRRKCIGYTWPRSLGDFSSRLHHFVGVHSVFHPGSSRPQLTQTSAVDLCS